VRAGKNSKISLWDSEYEDGKENRGVPYASFRFAVF
jgi:hypothetical protein